MGHLVVMQASRREFWAGEGELGCLNLPEQSVHVSLPSQGRPSPAPCPDSPWSVGYKGMLPGSLAYTAMTAGEA